MIDTITQFVTILVALSIASERLVEIVKNLTPSLRTQFADPDRESKRVAAINALAVVSGIFTTWLVLPSLELKAPVIAGVNPMVIVVGFGLLASGGSSMWNSVLGYLLGAKKLQQARVQMQARVTDAAAAAVAGPARAAIVGA